jgi:hypothetical protein
VRYQHNILRRKVNEGFAIPLLSIFTLNRTLNYFGASEFTSVLLPYIGWRILAATFCDLYRMYNMFMGLLISSEYDVYKHWDLLSEDERVALSKSLRSGIVSISSCLFVVFISLMIWYYF